MAWQGAPVTVHVLGAVRLTDRHGQDWTPPGTRPQAIIAALVTAGNYSRSRAWLQDLLWPTRTSAQGSVSLRQALSVIRKALPDPDLLVTKGGLVSLDPKRVRCDPEAEALAMRKAGHPVAEFAEGLDVPNAEFEDWIRDERQHQQDRFDALEDPEEEIDAPYMVNLPELPEDRDDYTTYFMDMFMAGLRDITRMAQCDIAGQADLHVQAEALGQGEMKRMRSQLFGKEKQGAYPQWSAFEDMSKDAGVSCSALMRLAHRCHEAAIDTLLIDDKMGDQPSGRALALRAASRLLDISEGVSEEVDNDLRSAYDRDPRGVYLGLRAFLRTNDIIERRSRDSAAVAEEARELLTAGLSAEPQNAMLNTAASHLFLLLDSDVHSAEHFARRATEANPGNPLAWFALANALVRAERPREALDASLRALSIGRVSRFSYWWEISTALVYTINNKPEEARSHAMTAHMQHPTFRPPLRYLTALNFHLGDVDAAGRYFDKLAALEPDLELEMFGDESYPTATLQQADFLRIAKIRSL